MTPSSVCPRQRLSRGTPVTTFVAFTGRVSYQRIAGGAAFSSALVIYRGSQHPTDSRHTIRSRMPDAWSVSACKSENRELATDRSYQQSHRNVFVAFAPYRAAFSP